VASRHVYTLRTGSGIPGFNLGITVNNGENRRVTPLYSLGVGRNLSNLGI